jgi:hypothetical protein
MAVYKLQGAVNALCCLVLILNGFVRFISRKKTHLYIPRRTSPYSLPAREEMNSMMLHGYAGFDLHGYAGFDGAAAARRTTMPYLVGLRVSSAGG